MVALAESGRNSDTVVLRAPRGKGTLPIMRVVIGGMASRHALPIDRLDDLQLAVEMLLREEPLQGDDLTLTVEYVDEVLTVTLAGLRSPFVQRVLSEPRDLGADEFAAPGILRRIMDALVDSYRTSDEATGASFAVGMEKRIR